MELTVHIPDDMGEADGDLARRALEAFALEEFKKERITKAELRRLLGFGTRWKLDGFLKDHGVLEEYTLDDFEQERAALKSLGL